MSEQATATPSAYDAALADMIDAARDKAHPYHEVAHVLTRAYQQASAGKGHERHGKDGIPFRSQRMQAIAKGQGHAGGLVYQICKKSQESEGLPTPAAVRDLLGAIIYACGTVLYRENADKEAGQ